MLYYLEQNLFQTFTVILLFFIITVLYGSVAASPGPSCRQEIKYEITMPIRQSRLG